ncbi:MAG: GNAT family N-acetyltransferase [candidate division Zixibacteria bacterium]|nr:GNAT family N-acetyltransferase [candidate division Zixibacteria bacterium]
MRRTGEITYFILPEFTGRGIGVELLGRLTEEAKARGIDTLLGSISSLNEGSLRFHLRHGFVECGRFRRIGRKQGRDFDVIWVQKFI